MSQDHLQRVLLERANVRCVVAHLDETCREILQRGHYPDRLARLLSEALVIAAMCSSGVKFQGRISLQLRATGALRLLLADCTDEGGLRGLARFDPQAMLAEPSFRELTGGGVLTMTVEPSSRGQIWQGIVPLSGDSLAEAIAAYFEQSEQLETRVILAVTEDAAAGMLVQRLPGRAEDEDGWQRVGHLIDTVRPEELLATDAETLLARLFQEEDRRIFPARPLRFHCPCSRQRVARVLRSLGEDELRGIIAERGEVEVACEFCNEQYRFDRLDIGSLLAGDLSGGLGDEHDGSDTLH
jgi:molecular chaperone Hsp33